MSATTLHGKPYTLEGPRGGRYAWTLATEPMYGADRKTAEIQAVLTVFWSPIDERYTVALHQVRTWTVLGIAHTSKTPHIDTTFTYVEAADQSRADIRAFARATRDQLSGDECAFQINDAAQDAA